MSKFDNIFIFVSDALRYDHLHPSLDSSGSTVRTLSPASWTPPSFCSLLTGLNPTNHNVNSFDDTLDKEFETIFDKFENKSFIAAPHDAFTSQVFKEHSINSIDLENIEEPFIVIERSMETHMPYNELGCKEELDENPDQPTSGRSYIKMLMNQNKWPELYEEAANKSAQHFWNHIKELEDRGILENTLVIYTSDHGEFIDEKSFGIRRVGHGHPMHSVLLDVPTVFLNYEIEAELMRSIDIIPTALSIIGKEKIGEGVDIREEQILDGWCQGEGMDKRLYRWRMTRNGPRCEEPLKLLLGKFIEDYKSAKLRIGRKFESEDENYSPKAEIIKNIEV